MAGNYPDVPAPRMAYDRDGTVGFTINTSNVIAVISGANLQIMNNENENQMFTLPNTGYSEYVGIIFPQMRDVHSILWQANPHDSSVIQSSVNTTNGLDGTWVSHGTTGRVLHTGANGSTGGAIVPTYRTSITAISLTGKKAIRLRLDTNFSKRVQTLHLYGSIVAGETPDRLRAWHPTLDEPLDDNTSVDGAHFDWGDVQRNTTSDKTFRIKNDSATLTANSILISQETPTDTSPAVNSQYMFSDGGAFAPSIDIGSLAPGAISPVITKRYTRPPTAILSLWASRTIVNPSSWT